MYNIFPIPYENLGIELVPMGRVTKVFGDIFVILKKVIAGGRRNWRDEQINSLNIYIYIIHLSHKCLNKNMHS